MYKNNQPFTLGIWTVKPGNEQAFIAAWSAFAEWTAKNQSGAGSGYLLRDGDRPLEFISFGPWDSPDAIKAWRDRPEFKSFASKARELCDNFQPRSLFVVAGSK